MGIKLRRLAATLLFSPGPNSPASSAADACQAVARATAHHPSTAPPSGHHLDALLAFGRGSRLSAAALASALVDRLRASASGHGDPYVALKCLVALRVLLASGAFILRDQLLVALTRHPASGRNPLALASFPLGRSFAAASWVRFAARLLELVLPLPDAAPADDADEYLTALPNPHLVAELAAFVAVADAVRGAPPPSTAPQHSALIWEAVRLAEEDRVTAERNIAARVREMGERLDTLSLADAVELVCVLRRVEEGAASSPAPEWKWAALDEGVVSAARQLRERAEEVVLRRTREERRVVRRDAGTTASARVLVPLRSGAGDAVRFGSTRWDGTVSSLLAAANSDRRRPPDLVDGHQIPRKRAEPLQLLCQWPHPHRSRSGAPPPRFRYAALPPGSRRLLSPRAAALRHRISRRPASFIAPPPHVPACRLLHHAPSKRLGPWVASQRGRGEEDNEVGD